MPAFHRHPCGAAANLQILDNLVVNWESRETMEAGGATTNVPGVHDLCLLHPCLHMSMMPPVDYL